MRLKIKGYLAELVAYWRERGIGKTGNRVPDKYLKAQLKSESGRKKKK